MSIPPFYHFMRPSLEFHVGRPAVSKKQLVPALADQLNPSDEERQELLPSGTSTKLYSRVSWALTYLRKALLIEKSGPGLNTITQRGGAYLKTAPGIIKPNDLMTFPEFAQFQANATAPSTVAVVANSTIVTEETTPEEDIDTAYLLLKEALAQEVLERVKSMPPVFFERLIVRLMLRLGYGGGTENAGQTLGQSGDGGVDGVIHEDKLGLDKIYLQAKRWAGNSSVGSPQVQAFVGALVGKGATKGVFITTSTFTGSAKEYAKNNHHAFKISLVDGTELARLMIDYDLGVSLVQRYEVKRIDSDFFADD